MERLARLVEEHCQLLLLGDQRAFARLKETAELEGKIFEQEYSLRLVRAQVEKAWQEKDFEKVEALYTSIKENLSPAEEKRFLYASKKKNEKNSKATNS